jgi:tetratricopeptide (TPR) repeat protein
MSSEPIKPIIFISYAHADEPDLPEQPAEGKIRWLSFVMKFLQPGVKGRKYQVWIDRLMPIGAKWKPEIEAQVRGCDIFILLVSTNSTGSDYILDKEVPIVRERQRNGEAVHFCPLLMDWTPAAGLEQVDDENFRPRDRKPFSSLAPSERSRQMAEAADEIADLAKAIAERKEAAAHQPDPSVLIVPDTAGIGARIPGRSGIYFDGISPAMPGESKPKAPTVLDISGLPKTGYERLVGRDAELTRLDEAWSDGKTNILSLVAEGGGGKSALVNEWLKGLRSDGYRGATIVLGWSFFSQGSKERATSADEFLNWTVAKLGVKLETTSASAKGEAIAEALTKRRALIILDGVEPLQHGPGPQAGQLKDQGLRALLRRCAAAPAVADHSLIVPTSRVAVADIQRFKDGAAPVVDVGKLSEAAGAELLRDNDVWGIESELRAASRDFAGHPLALTLLASFLKETQNGDVRRRDHIRGLLADADNPRHDQARRVMESYEKEWLANQPVLLAILHCVGLFDRPASGDCRKELRTKPVIRGLTDEIVKLGEGASRRSIARLREVRLLSPVDPSDPEALDAHPLVREWFGDRLRATSKAAWKKAHSRLYDHLRDTTDEGQTPTLADLAPLYHAIAHGCRAGRYKDALGEVYMNRICRRGPDGKVEFYASRKLGALGSNLAAISWFFDKPYEAATAALTPPDRAWVLTQASFALRGQGRLREALSAMRETLEEAQEWASAANRASNLCQTKLLIGSVAAAVATAEKSVALADNGRDKFWMSANRALLADAFYAAGEGAKAAGLFVDAEQRQREFQPDYPILHSFAGYLYCDLLLSQGRSAEVRERAAQTIEVARRQNYVLAVALDTLTIGRAHLALALGSLANGVSAGLASVDARAAAARLDQAIDGLRASGQNDDLSRGLIARAAFRRAAGNWDGAKRDLDEAEEIAEPGPMRLYLCDIALERARLALARREAFAPVAGLVEPSPPPPTLPSAAEATGFAE